MKVLHHGTESLGHTLRKIMLGDSSFFTQFYLDIEEKNRLGKTTDLFKKIRDTQGTFHAKMGSIQDRRYGPNRSRRYQEEVARIHKNCTKKIFMTQIIMMV